MVLYYSSSNNDFDAFFFQRSLKLRADIGIGNQFVHALEAALYWEFLPNFDESAIRITSRAALHIALLTV